MAKKIKKDAAKAKQAEETKTTENTATETQGADNEAKGEDKGSEPVIPEPEAKVIERPAEACDVWGENDPNSRICKTCPVEKECKEYTKSLSAAKPKASSPRKERAAHDGNYTKFGHCRATSQAGLIELALEKPTTIEELMAASGSTKSRVVSHLGFLNKKGTCKKVDDKDGKFHYELVSAAPEGAAQ